MTKVPKETSRNRLLHTSMNKQVHRHGNSKPKGAAGVLCIVSCSTQLATTERTQHHLQLFQKYMHRHEA